MHVEKSLNIIEKHDKFGLRLLEPVDFSINLLSNSIIISGAKAALHDMRDGFQQPPAQRKHGSWVALIFADNRFLDFFGAKYGRYIRVGQKLKICTTFCVCRINYVKSDLHTLTVTL